MMWIFNRRKKWATEILALYEKYYADFEGESDLVKMSRALKAMQGLKYYGCYFYSVRELENHAELKGQEGDVGLSWLDEKKDRPSEGRSSGISGILGRKTSSPVTGNEYWICMDLEGITLISRDFRNRFLYFTGAANCVTKWGAKDNVILLQLREPGRHYCCLFVCRMGLDIAYCMFRLSKARTAISAGAHGGAGRGSSSNEGGKSRSGERSSTGRLGS